MLIEFREPVILASDFSSLVAWYRDALGLKVVKLVEDAYHYCNLESDSGLKIGIASAQEMGVTPRSRTSSTVVLQFRVPTLQEFFNHIEAKGGTIINGPTFDARDSFWFGSIADPEGNPFWVVDANCP